MGSMASGPTNVSMAMALSSFSRSSTFSSFSTVTYWPFWYSYPDTMSSLATSPWTRHTSRHRPARPAVNRFGSEGAARADDQLRPYDRTWRAGCGSAGRAPASSHVEVVMVAVAIPPAPIPDLPAYDSDQSVSLAAACR